MKVGREAVDADRAKRKEVMGLRKRKILPLLRPDYN